MWTFASQCISLLLSIFICRKRVTRKTLPLQSPVTVFNARVCYKPFFTNRFEIDAAAAVSVLVVDLRTVAAKRKVLQGLASFAAFRPFPSWPPLRGFPSHRYSCSCRLLSVYRTFFTVTRGITWNFSLSSLIVFEIMFRCLGLREDWYASLLPHL